MNKLLLFSACVRFEKIHPLQGGFIRRRYRHDRRHGLPMESALRFYANNLLHNINVYTRLTFLYFHYLFICKRVEWDPRPYDDLATGEVEEEQLDELQIFTETAGGKDALNTARRKAAVREVKVNLDRLKRASKTVEESVH